MTGPGYAFAVISLEVNPGRYDAPFMKHTQGSRVVGYMVKSIKLSPKEYSDVCHRKVVSAIWPHRAAFLDCYQIFSSWQKLMADVSQLHQAGGIPKYIVIVTKIIILINSNPKYIIFSVCIWSVTLKNDSKQKNLEQMWFNFVFCLKT